MTHWCNDRYARLCNITAYELTRFFTLIVMESTVGGYSVLLNPLHCYKYLMDFYHGKLQVAGKTWCINIISIHVTRYCTVRGPVDQLAFVVHNCKNVCIFTF